MGSRREEDGKQAERRESSLFPKNDARPKVAAHPIVQLQQKVGNRSVARQLASGRLSLGMPGDTYEKEADQAAQSLTHGTPIQRQKLSSISSVSPAAPAVSPALEESIEQARSGGQPMEKNVRGTMEKAFGEDFGGVRVHTDTQADMLNRSLGARAFTKGRDIYFRQGAYEPGTRSGQELIAHELTHTLQQRGQERIQRSSIKDELDQELAAWAKKEGKTTDPSNKEYAFDLQEYAWSFIVDVDAISPLPKPKGKKDRKAWEKKFRKAELLAKMILAGGKRVQQKEDRAALILNLVAKAGFGDEAVQVAKGMTDTEQIEYVYSAILNRVGDASPESLATITEFLIKKKGKKDNPVFEKLTDSKGSFESKLSNEQVTAVLKPLIKAYEKDPVIIDLLSETLVHKPKYRKVFSDWMWKEGKEEFLFEILESKYFIEPEYGPSIFPEVGELKLEKDMAWVYANKQKYYVGYLVQLGKESAVDIKQPKNMKFATLRKWLDDHTEKIGEALAKKFPSDPGRWIKVYEQITDIFFYHVDGRDIKPDRFGKLKKLKAGAPNKLRLKSDCDVLATYAMRYFFGVKNSTAPATPGEPAPPAIKMFEPVAYLALDPTDHVGHAVALMRRDGKYYVISNKQVFPTAVVEGTKDGKKPAGVTAMKKQAMGVYEPAPAKYKVYVADALPGGGMPKALAKTEASTRRTDLEPGSSP